METTEAVQKVSPPSTARPESGAVQVILPVTFTHLPPLSPAQRLLQPAADHTSPGTSPSLGPADVSPPGC